MAESLPACDNGCIAAEYWRDEVLAVRADLDAADRRAVLDQLTALSVDTGLYGDDLVGWQQAVDWHTGYDAGRSRGTAPVGELLAYDDGPAPMSTGERLVALALVGPWLACSAGWAVVTTAHELIRWTRR